MSKICLIGQVQKIIFSGDNGYTILSIFFDDTKTSEKIVGYVKVIVGQKYQFTGEYVDNAKYGEQFYISSYEMVKISQGDEIIDFLSSKHFKGVGKRTATKIYEQFKEQTLDVIKDEPERLKNIGVNQEIITELSNKLNNLTGIEQLYQLLRPLNFSDILITEIYKYLQIIKEENVVGYVKYNSYSLIDHIDYLTFEKADQIFLKYNGDLDSIERYKSAIIFFANKYCYQNGDTVFEIKKIISDLSQKKILNPDLIDQAISKLISIEILIKLNDDQYILFDFYEAEKSIAMSIKLKQESISKTIDNKIITKKLSELESRFKISYSPVQHQAIKSAVSNNLSIITGGPGTGKTTIIKAIATIFTEDVSLDIDEQISRKSIILCAPTGRAAQRMKEATGLQSRTIHSLLEWDPYTKSFNRDIDDPLVQDLIIIDEFSMVDIFLAMSLFKAIRPEAIIVIVGDAAQLESVNPGNVIGDLIRSQKIATVHLDQIFRQGDGSTIAKLAENIDNNLEFELSNTHDMSIINKQKNITDIVKQVVDKSYEAGFSEFDVQVLYPKYAGDSGINNLNKKLKPDITKDFFETANDKLQVGDKVMQLKNNYEKDIYNGDIGFIQAIVNQKAKATEIALIVKFKDKEVKLTKKDLLDLTHAYAISIHKSQGSEFKVVIIPITKESFHMLSKKLLYTAITRAKDKLILVGEINIFYNGIMKENQKRETYLSKLLIDPKLFNQGLENELVQVVNPYDFLEEESK